MTEQTKEQQAEALSEMGVVIQAAQEAHAHGLLTGTSNWAAYIYNAVAQQVREAHTAELVANAGVIPPVYSEGQDGEDICYAEEVYEAIAAMQVQLEQAGIDNGVLRMELARKNHALDVERKAEEQSQARVLELEKDSEELSVLGSDLLMWVERAVEKGNANNDIEEAYERYNKWVCEHAAMKKGGGV
jgi:hypothetical protein